MVVIEKNEGLGVTSEESPVVGLVLGARTKDRSALEEAVPGVVVNDFSVAANVEIVTSNTNDI